jgi:hypothetical protein
MHRRVASAAVLDPVLSPRRILDRIALAVLAADEPFERTSVLASGLTTPANRHRDSANHYTSQPKSIHCNSPRTGAFTIGIRNFDASVCGRKPP